MVETEVTYTLEHAGEVIIIEHVPARVCSETAPKPMARNARIGKAGLRQNGPENHRRILRLHA